MAYSIAALASPAMAIACTKRVCKYTCQGEVGITLEDVRKSLFRKVSAV